MTAAAHALVNAVATSSHLAGVGSIDFVASGGDLRPVEVNPRWSASMELVERERGTSMFAIHADACTRGVLPEFDLAQPADARAFHGKAVVFARQDVVVGDTRAWLHDPDVRDVPREGDRIAAGQPVCTVFAVGSDDETCHARLGERAQRIYSELRGDY
jgi:predicted ATP-grasp superfamily ATP-dependent carboligase